jgi:tRNA(Glu) U13 pseudouridine synthase TruD
MLKEYMFVPIIGSKLNIHRPELRVLIDDILTVEEVSIKDFRINELGLEVKGDHRQSMARAFDVKFVIDENMLKFFFTLSRGNYATVFLRELLRVNPLLYT